MLILERSVPHIKITWPIPKLRKPAAYKITSYVIVEPSAMNNLGSRGKMNNMLNMMEKSFFPKNTR